MNLFAINQLGVMTQVNRLIALRYETELIKPGSFITFSVPMGAVNADCIRLQLMDPQTGTLCFSGRLYRRKAVWSGGFWQEELTAAGYDAGLTENQVQPQQRQNLTSAQLYSEFVAPYMRTSANDLPAGQIASIEITRGMTAWGVVDTFCRQVYQKIPKLTRDGRLTVDWDTGNTHAIGNQPASAHPYAALSFLDDRTSLLSVVYGQRQDDDGFPYSMVSDLTPSYGLMRSRYVKISPAWAGQPALAVQERMLNAQIDSYELEITLPELLWAEPGDQVTLDDPIASFDDYYVSKVRVSFSPSGAQTVLQCWSSERLSVPSALL